jgi:hypothetical protein
MKTLNVLIKNIRKYGTLFLLKLIFFEIINLYRLRFHDYFIQGTHQKNFQPFIPSPYYNLKLIENYIEKESLFIDFGCGTGRVLNYFCKSNKIIKLLGFEINNSFKKYNINLKKKIEIYYINCENIDLINKKIKNFKYKNLTLFFYHPFENRLISKIIENFLNKGENVTIVLIGKINIQNKLKDNLKLFKINQMMRIYKSKKSFS